ncbi:non-hydrolyzing UDP-N-acetylglucosamine 2-epimerase [Altericroceibacterium xinjiangense]|uniref:non-hydrolyzing UDP-N-acetylglucosamine 2-epimerase n=1 Tax=Altericroceibacterium xinjiangense TaxID=762261 RepID=UPI000F7D7BC0|nr:UDP-N-acetylglucosamine 2-epimerase (non-hydrolyzing) [Altericroceibacterium xinjiangense]
MTGAKRILTVFGTRPEAIKLFPILHALSGDTRFLSRTCLSGQHRELLDPVLEVAEIRPDHVLEVMSPGQSLDELTAKLITGIGRVLDSERPEWVVVQGDTATAVCAALAAYHRRIPVAHVEAGLRSGDIHQPWPEEVNRKIIGTLAALHFAPTQRACEALIRENIDPATVHQTGNTVIDALQWMSRRIDNEPALASALDELEQRFSGKRIIGVTTHRRENFGRGLEHIAEAILRIAGRGDVGLIVPVHLNPEVRQVIESKLTNVPNIALVDPLDYPQFVRLLQISSLMLTDSGGVQEEAPALGTPVLVMRETTERAEGIEAGTARLVGTDPDRIVAETFRLLDDPAAHAEMARARNPFGDGRSAERIVELLASV